MNLTFTNNEKEMINSAKSIIKEKQQIYNANVVNEIKQSLANHFKGSSKAELDNHFYKSVYNYWAYGCSVDEYFYLNFCKLSHAEKIKYITHKKRLNLIYQVNNVKKRYICDDKYETYKLLKPFYLREMISLSGKKDYKKFYSFAKKHKEFVVKQNNSCCAIGVFKETVKTESDIKKVFNKLINDKTLLGKGNIIVEELIVQDKSIGIFHPTSINGIRVTTIRKKNKVSIIHPWIKIGANGTFVASAVMGGVDVGINAKNGKIITNGFGELGEEYSKHPNTGVKFLGYRIPHWNELKRLSKKLALMMPNDINYIGWDFVLTPKGWCVMEANFSGDSMWQLFLKKPYLKEFEHQLGCKVNKKFWWE